MVKREHHLVVHRAAMLRAGVQHERDRAVRFLPRVVTSFQSSFRPVENDFRHDGDRVSSPDDEAGHVSRNFRWLDWDITWLVAENPAKIPSFA